MPYQTVGGGFERAGRTSHAEAVVRALSERNAFHVPAEHVGDLTWLAERVEPRAALVRPGDAGRLGAVVAVDGSRMVVQVRDGLPSVRYGYAQTAAVYLDLDAMETARGDRFVDPVALAAAVNSALVSFDMPVSGAYTRRGVSLQESWREAVDALFRAKRVAVNGLNQRLLDLLLLLHGTPGAPATAVPVNCPHRGCGARDVPVGEDGRACPGCGGRLLPTDVLRISEEVVDDGTNEVPLSRLMQVVELLVLVGLVTLLWEQARRDLLPATLFVVDGPLAVYGPPAKLRARALAYVQAMMRTTSGDGPHVCGLEKTGALVDYAHALVRHDALEKGELLVVDERVLQAVTNATNPRAYGAETYWGRKFVYRALDGRVVVLTVPPETGAPYDDHGGLPHPADYPSLPAVLDVVDRTGSAMYRDGIVPVALAHGRAAYPIGVGTDVLKLVARRRLGLDARGRHALTGADAASGVARHGRGRLAS